jgi:CRP/FNR family transcriptional regulator
VSRHGSEKITGFHLAGELLGLDAISAGRHGFDAVALEDSEVCAVRFAALEKLALTVPVLQHQLFRLLSSDISRDQGLMLLLGSMAAEQRLAAFLLSLSRRYQRLGFAASRFALRMTREEIGNYLGLTLETISRLFSRFQREGLLKVRGREVELRNVERLREIVG